MDSLRGSDSDVHRAMASTFATGRPGDSHPVGNPWRRPGIDRTWRLVGRRSPFWMEAHRYSNSKELAFTLRRGVFADQREYPRDPLYSVGNRLDLGFCAGGASSIIRDKNEKICMQSKQANAQELLIYPSA